METGMGWEFGKSGGMFAVGAALCVSAMLCNAARAQDSTGAYVGANFGRALNSYNTGYLDQQYQDEAAEAGDTLGLSSRSVHRFDWVWWADAGYYFTPYVALDAAYLHLGEFRYKSAGQLNVGGVEVPTTTSAEVTSHGPALSVLGRLPLTESIEVDLRLGDYLGKTAFYNRIDVAAGSIVVNESKTTSSLLAAVGAAYSFAGHWSARLDYLRVNKTGDSDTSGKFSVNVASAGVSYTF
jgi:OmpA-like transmembrane domain